MIRLLFILMVALTWSAQGATYYIRSTGSDANPGTSPSAPWQHLPVQGQFAGTYTYASGDRWTTAFGDTITIFGTCQMTKGAQALSNVTLGALDPSFGDGTTNNTKLDFRGVELNANHFDVGFLFPANPAATGVTFQNLDFTNLYWDGSTANGIPYAWACYISKTGIGTITCNGCRFLNWSHAPYPSSNSRFYCIFGSGFQNGAFDGTLTNCVFDGVTTDNSTQNQSSGGGVYNWGGNITHCQLRNCGDGFIVGPASGVTQDTGFCDIGPVFFPYDPGGHPDNLFMNGGTSFKWHDNYIHDGYVLSVFTGEGSGSEDVFFWNNVVYNCKTAAPFVIDNLFSGAREWVWNNTLVGGSFPGVRVTNRGNGPLGVLSLLNNLIISDSGAIQIDAGGTITHLTNANNVVLTQTAAAANGFTLANRYQPSNGASPGVGAGQSLASQLSGALTKDILGVTRPQGSSWDSGAYEFMNTGGAPGTISLTTTTNSANEGTSITVNAQRTGGSSGAVGVSLMTVAGTATPGVNYTGLSTTLNWANGDTAVKSATVTLLTEPFVGSKQFTVTISNPTGGATTTAPTTQTETIIGVGSPPPPPVFGLNFEAEAGSYAPDWVGFTNGAIKGIVNGNANGSIYGQTGVASYKFTNAAGPYRVFIVAAAVDQDSNSLWIDINNSMPNDPTNIWDIPITGSSTTYATNAVSLRGGGGNTTPQYPANVWTLAAGTNTLYLMPRETGGYLDRISIVSATPPTNPPSIIASVVSAVSAAPGFFNAGKTIPVTVSFSTNVFVTGTPQLAVNTSTNAPYTSGSGSSNLVFTYTVAPGQNTQMLDAAATNALTLAGGTIQDVNGTNAVLTLPAPGQPGSISFNATLVVDTVAPTIALGSPSTFNITNLNDIVTIPVMYADLNFDKSTLGLADLIITRVSGNPNLGFAAAIVGAGPTQSIQLSSFQGNGVLNVSISQGSARDKAGNFAPASVPSQNISVSVSPSVIIHNATLNNAAISPTH